MKDHASKEQKSDEKKGREYFKAYIEKRSNAPVYFFGVFLFMLGLAFLFFKTFTPRETTVPDIKILFVSVAIALVVTLVFFLMALLLKLEWSLSCFFYLFYFFLFCTYITVKQRGELTINWDFLICIALLGYGEVIVKSRLFKCLGEKLAEIDSNKELPIAS